MKSVAIAAVALIVGIVLGGLGPRAELREVRQTQAKVAAAPCPEGPSVGADLAQFFGGARTMRPPPESPQARVDRLQAENPAAAELALEIEAAEAEAEAEVGEALRAAVENGEELELARAALELRAAQARAALVEQADPDRDQQQAIDDAYGEMNESLMDLAGELGDLVAEGREPTRREAMTFAADALDAMLAAEQQVEGALQADQLADLDDGAINPFSHVDPALMDVLIELGE
jgi:hypothetical protein